ncbi:MAG: hypothetical protein IIC12_03810 [Proteobacteria bacterium]|nr:hypothetical protein [Pseudomonadota bacterium]
MRQIFVAGRAAMQLFLVLVVLVFSFPLIVYASPIILYLAPLIVIGFLVSFLTNYVRRHSKTARH